MPFITREDGERFVIPSYRDIISVKKKNLLKKEILLLTTNYGGYITIQRKDSTRYEVAFSQEPGYLLGETVWHYFKRPQDLIYCEALPNTTDAILVIVKGGSVYIDGVFPIDSIAEELVVFRTQQNNFNIYIYGDIPIGQTADEGKFVFDDASVQSFTVLDHSAYQALPKLKYFNLQLVDVVLAQQGIGVFPVRQALALLIVVGLGWMGWTYFTTHKKELPKILISAVSPYQMYMQTLTSPDPSVVMHGFSHNILFLYTIPGWVPDEVTYSNGKLRTSVRSLGGSANVLFTWAKQNDVTVDVLPEGFFLQWRMGLTNRSTPQTISPLKEVLGALVDRVSYVYPGNVLQISAFVNKRSYNETSVTLNITDVTPATLDLLGQQFKDLPLVISNVTMKVADGHLSGSIILQALGN